MPSIPEALNHAWGLHQSGQVVAAEQIYRRVVEAKADEPNAWCYLGIALFDLKRFEESEEAYRQAIALHADFPVAYSNLANTLSAMRRFDEAIACCRQAMELQPDYSTPYLNLGSILVKQGKPQEATSWFEKALELSPQNANAHKNLGAALVQQGKLEEAAEQSQRALELQPRMAEAHRNNAIVRLMRGDFEKGWEEFEWRWSCSDMELPAAARPLWNGESLEGKRVLLFCEQGLGDTLHFVRYASLLKRAGATVLAACQRPLLKLLRSAKDVDQLLCTADPWPTCDYYLPMMSAPRLFRTNLENMFAETPYLWAAPQLVENWRPRIPGRLRVGLAWQGSTTHPGDQQRSLPLSAFEPLASIEGVQLVSLQKGFGSEQINTTPGLNLLDFGDELDASSGPFMDTAAIMSCLDVIVTSDTSVAHLAGALDRTVFVALSISPDWRWLLDRSDSPWYPSMRLFRQQKLGEWGEPVRQIAAELDKLSRARKNVVSSPVSPSTLARVSVELTPRQLLDGLALLRAEVESGQPERARQQLPEWEEALARLALPAEADQWLEELVAIHRGEREADLITEELSAEVLKSLALGRRHYRSLLQTIDEALQS